MQRTAKALSGWLLPTRKFRIELMPDLDSIEALTPEREALWKRLESARFLTVDEKRAIVGYGPTPKRSEPLARKFNPNHDQLGRFTTADGAASGAQTSTASPEDDARDGSDSSGQDSGGQVEDVQARVVLAAGKSGGLPKAVWQLTVRQFISKYCSGRINRELPGEFEDVTIADIIDLARGGDAAARKCEKILEQPRFRK